MNLINKNIINDLYRNILYVKREYKKLNITNKFNKNLLGVNIIKTIYDKNNNDKLYTEILYLVQNQNNRNNNKNTFPIFDENEIIVRLSK